MRSCKEHRSKVRELLSNKEKPDFINLNWGEAWEKMWRSVSADTWKEIAKIEEFDRAVTEKIIGFELTCLDEVSCAGKVVEIDGKKYKLVEA